MPRIRIYGQILTIYAVMAHEVLYYKQTTYADIIQDHIAEGKLNGLYLPVMDLFLFD
jgi:hypothetical protein